MLVVASFYFVHFILRVYVMILNMLLFTVTYGKNVLNIEIILVLIYEIAFRIIG